jgi:hypothetical protein
MTDNSDQAQPLIEENKADLKVEETLTKKGEAMLKDFNTKGDDVKEISKKKLEKMDRYTRFEK